MDKHLGSKLRTLRNIKGLSQSALAQESGITFQQVQKYEKGVNRISAARLADFARILGTDIDYFYKDYKETKATKKYSFGENESEAFLKQNLFESKETINLVREYYKIKDATKRRHIVEIIKAMSGGK